MTARMLVAAFAALALLFSAQADASTGGVAVPAGGGTSVHKRVSVHKKKKHKRKKRRKKRRHSTTAAPPATTPATPVAGMTGYAYPVAGAHSYGGPANAFGAPRGTHIHQGQDILAAEGTPVVAPHSGTVRVVAYQASGAGVYVVLHDSAGTYEFAFMHLQSGSVLVGVGDTVSAGQQIANVGHTGDAEGPHLHFEAWLGPWQTGGTAVDPLPLLQAWDTGA